MLIYIEKLRKTSKTKIQLFKILFRRLTTFNQLKSNAVIDYLIFSSLVCPCLQCWEDFRFWWPWSLNIIFLGRSIVCRSVAHSTYEFNTFYSVEIRITASWPVQFSVYTMIFGAIVAASQDLAFSFSGYTYVSLNNILTASNGVYLKKKLDAKDLGKNGLLFYNSLFMIPFAFCIAWWTEDVQAVSQYLNFLFNFCWVDVLYYFLFRHGNSRIGATFGFSLNS